MKSDRHPHPHIDPRQPRNGSLPGTNPPVFAWMPPRQAKDFRLVVARDAALGDIELDEPHLEDPVFLPERALAAGRYFWQWSTPGAEGEVFSFHIASDAVTLEVPAAATWLHRFPAGHPRIWMRPEELAALRASRMGDRAGLWADLQTEADRILAEPHHMDEPPFLPDMNEDYEKFYAAWLPVLHQSRRFVRDALTLALAYVAGGDTRYARAACQRLASISRWDPMGSSHIGHNDEAHMSVIWHGAIVCDWVWDQFTLDERQRVIDQFRRRGEITFEHMHDRGSYGVTRFTSHSGREIVFLALIALVFHEHIPDAGRWLDWLRPVLCGIWPIWAGDDGAWAEGPSYGLAYVEIMTMFASALKHGAGVNLYRRPFWRGHARWRQWCFPPYAQWVGFGDHTERWSGNWLANADLVELIDRETGAGEFAQYVADFRREAQHAPAPAERRQTAPSPLRYLSAPPTGQSVAADGQQNVLGVFPGAGWAAFRTDLHDPQRDVALLFRSSPFGSISHSHANNNDFILHVGGQVLAMPSGYYNGYGSNHHTHWVWHTKSHNCLTLSGASQLMESHDSAGAVVNAFEDERLAYVAGIADASYATHAQRCRRHVVWLKRSGCFVMIDELVLRPGIAVAMEWNIHSWARFAVDEASRKFAVEREGSRLVGHFMHHHNAFFSLTDGWEPPPTAPKPSDQWLMQYHLRFVPAGLWSPRTLGVVLCPSSAAIKPADVRCERDGEVEVARIGDDSIIVNRGRGIDLVAGRTDALALVQAGGVSYEISDNGIGRVGS